MSGANIEPAWLRAGPLGDEAEQEPERVAVARDRVRAGIALACETFGEESLQRGSERGHGRVRLSRRAAASSISSGEADRYQYVPAGLTWPR